MRGKPKRGVLRHSNLQFSELLKVLKTGSAGRKDFFDTLSREPNIGSLLFALICFHRGSRLPAASEVVVEDVPRVGVVIAVVI